MADSRTDGAVDNVEELAAVALSGESEPLNLYRYVRAQHEPVAPEEVARARWVPYSSLRLSTWTGWSRPRCSTIGHHP